MYRARLELLDALKDGAVVAHGQCTFCTEEVVQAPDWPGVEAVWNSPSPAGPVTTDWWIGVNLDVQLVWHANAMWRKRGAGFEVMRAIRFKLDEVRARWPALSISEAQASKVTGDILRCLRAMMPLGGKVTKSQAKEATEGKIDGFTNKSFERAWAELEPARKLGRGKRGPDKTSGRVLGRRGPKGLLR
jgi:hypothetical protein